MDFQIARYIRDPEKYYEKKNRGQYADIFNRQALDKKMNNKKPEARDKIRTAVPKPRPETKIWDKGGGPLLVYRPKITVAEAGWLKSLDLPPLFVFTLNQ